MNEASVMSVAPAGLATPANHARPGDAQPINPLAQPNWDALVARHPQASLFHTTAWAKVLAGAYGYKAAYFALNEGGGPQALLPVMEVDSWLTGRRGVALPFADDCEPLYSDITSIKDLTQTVLAYGWKRHWKYAEFRGGRTVFEGVPPSLSFHGHIIDLAQPEDTLSGRLESSVRRAIRKAEKSDVMVEFSNKLEAVRTYYTLHCQTRRKHGLPPQSFGFFRNIHEHILSRNMGVVALARHADKPVAANVYFLHGGQAIYKYGASDETAQHLRASNLVMWEAMKWCIRNGAKNLHLGRTSIANEGLRRFKLGWGAEEHQVEYFKYDFRKRGYVTDTDEAFGWHNRVFRKLPVFLSRLVGAALYRHIA
jgi:hypothetical protein